MPCLILTGHPSSGKTTLAKLIAERALLLDSIDNVVIVNEESVFSDQTKSTCYHDALAEKKTRGALKSAFDRLQDAQKSNNDKKRTLIILDSLNYIKGFRYELHCISKAACTQHGVVWVLNDLETIKDWNEQRGTNAYPADLLDELIKRYEPPDSRNRWDSPLYRINLGSTSSNDASSTKAVLDNSVYNMHNLSDALKSDSTDTTPEPTVEMVKSTRKPLRSGFKRAPTKPKKDTNESDNVTLQKQVDDAAIVYKTDSMLNVTAIQTPASPVVSLVQQVDALLVAFLANKPLVEGTSTRQFVATNADSLQRVDNVTLRVVKAVQAELEQHAVGNLSISVPLGSSDEMHTCYLKLDKTLTLLELQSIRQQYIKWFTTYPPSDTSESGLIKAFVAFIGARK